MKYKVIISFSALGLVLGIASLAFGELQTEWEAKFSKSPIIFGEASDVATDASGNVYVVGTQHKADALGIHRDILLAKFNSLGTLDSFFSGDGMVDFDGGAADSGTAVALDPSGNVFVLGETQVNAADTYLVILKYNSLGVLDTTFGSGGKVVFTNAEKAGDIVVDALGSVYITGSHKTPIKDELIVAKINSSGALDTTLGGDGVLAYTFENGVAITVDASLRIYVLSNDVITNGRYRIRKLEPDGRLFTQFGSSGTVSAPLANELGYDLTIDSSNKVYLVSRAGGTTYFSKYLSTGALDNSFSGDGQEVVAAGAGFGLSIGSNTMIHVTGATGGQDTFVVKLSSTGGADTSFDGDGQVTYSGAAQNGNSFGRRLAQDSQGNIYVAGGESFNSGTLNVWTLLKYSSTGTATSLASTMGTVRNEGLALDSLGNVFAVGSLFSGGTKGWDIVVLQYNSAGNLSNTISYDSGGDDYGVDVATTVGGIYVTGNAGSDIVLLKYNSSGQLDTTFATNGVQRYTEGNVDIVQDMTLDSNGKIYLAGQTTTGGNMDVLVVKYDTQGSTDTSFSSDGIATYDNGGASDIGYGIAVSSTGKIFVAGSTGNDAIILNYNADGAFNTDFSGDGQEIFNSGDIDLARAITLDSSGRIDIAGNYGPGTENAIALRYKPIGTMDTSFRTQGFSISTSPFAVTDMALDSLGNVYVAGSASDKLFIAKFKNDGALDTKFGQDGVVTADSYFTGDSASGIVAGQNSLIITGTYAQFMGWTLSTPLSQTFAATARTFTHVTPNGPLTVDVPAGSFSEAVKFEFKTAVSTDFPKGTFPAIQMNPVKVGVEITLDKEVQSAADVLVTVPYAETDAQDKDEIKFVLARYDKTSDAWIPLSSTVNTALNKVGGKTRHFSLFQIMQTVPSPALDQAKVFPNPFLPSTGHTQIKFSKMPTDAKVKIYNLTGELIKGEMAADSFGQVAWDVTTDAGQKVASGIYLALIEGTGGKKILKVAIER